MAEIDCPELLVVVGKIRGGYDGDLFIENVEQFLCAICSGVCREPQQISNCGHIFCKPCIGYIISHSGFSLKCPLDNVPITKTQVKEDLFLRRLINSFNIKCTMHEKGCEWIGELDCATKHISTCEYRTVSSAAPAPTPAPAPAPALAPSPSLSPLTSSLRPSVRTMPRLPSSIPPRPNRANLQLSFDDDYMHQDVESIFLAGEATSPPPLPPRFVQFSRALSPMHQQTEANPITPLEYPWYREGMSRKEAEQHLLTYGVEGGFVVRPSMTRTPGNYSLSILYERQILHFRVQKKQDNSFILGESISKRFTSVEELVDYYLHNSIYMHDGRNAKLSQVFTAHSQL